MAFILDGKTILIIGLVCIIAYLLLKPQESTFVLEGAPLEGAGDEVDKSVNFKDSVKQMYTSGKDIGVVEQPGDVQTVPAALLPNEVPVTEDFGQFSTDDILSGQNYLDPRTQIGYPETVGGTLRNANLQIRSEPANPRDPVSIWNLSTITPEAMRPLFEIQDKEYE